MERAEVIAAFVCLVMVGACGSSNSQTGSDTPDGGSVTIPADAASAASPFVPAAVQGAISTIVAECEARGLTAAQKPAVAVSLKELTGFSAPIVVGANRMSTRLGSMSVVESPYDPSADPTAPDAVAKAAARQVGVINGYISGKLYKGLAIAPLEATRCLGRAKRASTIAGGLPPTPTWPSTTRSPA